MKNTHQPTTETVICCERLVAQIWTCLLCVFSQLQHYLLCVEWDVKPYSVLAYSLHSVCHNGVYYIHVKNSWHVKCTGCGGYFYSCMTFTLDKLENSGMRRMVVVQRRSLAVFPFLTSRTVIAVWMALASAAFTAKLDASANRDGVVHHVIYVSLSYSFLNIIPKLIISLSLCRSAWVERLRPSVCLSLCLFVCLSAA